ncbi:transposase [Rhodococcus opacus]|uniref:Transposase n=1 Tax=Rhodococcus opacus TaxID=37919 RepID=A0AAX3YNQ1_RHOOP|nr:transposase [Rhodococcus opacus]MCZ4588530.1 transposase [Rhodococcus opacus]WLF51177.1 transposase [Rhodococcus opacus]
MRQLDLLGSELATADRELAIEAFADPVVRHLMTIPGVDAVVGLSVVAAVGDFGWFASAEKLVA